MTAGSHTFVAAAAPAATAAELAPAGCTGRRCASSRSSAAFQLPCERGLLSVAFDPQFATTHRFYVDYTARNGDTRIDEYRADTDGLRVLPDSRRELLRVRQPFPNHNRGQLAFAATPMALGRSGADPHRVAIAGVGLGRFGARDIAAASVSRRATAAASPLA